MNWANSTEYCSSLSYFQIEKCRNGTKAPTTILEKLGENQGGTGRHKCTNCAFKKGFEYGLFGSTKTEIQLHSYSNIDLETVPAPKGIKLKTKNISSSGKTNFLEKERNNRKLGLLGELFILHYEKEKLIEAGLGKFAKHVEHISQTKGDGQGYDILSFNKFGQKKMIEVKTTRSGINRPFYITRNELEVSTKNSTVYYLYRLFDFILNRIKVNTT